MTSPHLIDKPLCSHLNLLERGGFVIEKECHPENRKINVLKTGKLLFPGKVISY